MLLPEYKVQNSEVIPSINNWDDDCWKNIEEINVSCFRPESSDHHPITKAKMVYNHNFLFGIFQVKDKYVRCINTEFQSPVYKDSCVEFFVQPKKERGYFNFEFNAAGTLLAHYRELQENHSTPLDDNEGKSIKIFHSVSGKVYPEIQEEIDWVLGFQIPIELLEKYVGTIGNLPGQMWRANFYKCGDETSHPHWAAWAQVDELNFHMPQCFGKIYFT